MVGHYTLKNGEPVYIEESELPQVTLFIHSL